MWNRNFWDGISTFLRMLWMRKVWLHHSPSCFVSSLIERVMFRFARDIWRHLWCHKLGNWSDSSSKSSPFDKGSERELGFPNWTTTLIWPYSKGSWLKDGLTIYLTKDWLLLFSPLKWNVFFYPMFANYVHVKRQHRQVSFTFGKSFENPKMFVWTRKMQFWQPCRKISTKVWNFFAQSPEIIKKKLFQKKSIFPRNIPLDS